MLRRVLGLRHGLSGEEGEYDIVVIGSGMGGLACGAISAFGATVAGTGAAER